jgi:hypothetical protein
VGRDGTRRRSDVRWRCHRRGHRLDLPARTLSGGAAGCPSGSRSTFPNRSRTGRTSGKKRHWYDPRSWFCWFTTYLVKIIRWVVVTVVKMVLTIACRIIERVVSIVLDLIRLVYHLIKALVTWDGCVLQEALSDLADARVGVFTILYVIVDPIAGEVNVYRLRGYVSDQIRAG